MLQDISKAFKVGKAKKSESRTKSYGRSIQSLKTNRSHSKCHKRIHKILNHSITSTLLAMLTVYALFGDDMRLAWTDKSTDEIFYALSAFCFFLFSLELIFSCIVKDNFLFSFFFWLDIITLVSLIPDIGWVWEPFLTLTTGSEGNSDLTNPSQIARAARASRVGSRAGRIIKVLRMLRLIRIGKLYKISQNSRHPMNQEIDDKFSNESQESVIEDNRDDYYEQFPPPVNLRNENRNQMLVREGKNKGTEEVLEMIIPEESKLGKKLGELATRRTIVLILGMFFLLPLFYINLYQDRNTSYQFGLEVLDLFVYRDKEFNRAWDLYLSEHIDLQTPLICLEVKNKNLYESDLKADDLRDIEKEFVSLKDASDDYEFLSLAIFDLRSHTQLEALLSLMLTIFICALLAIYAIIFSYDAHKWVINPIENMIFKIKEISQNPLMAVHKEEQERVGRELLENKSEDRTIELLETHVLENTLTKIAALLVLGFGEAGSRVIISNIQKGGGDVDPMVPGKRVYCIFGFCDIRSFTDTTEILQQEVMQFVNEIAWVVHSTVNYFSGSANKNIGDAFLLVWKMPEDFTLQSGEVISVADDPDVSVLADMSVLSVVKIIAELNTNPRITKYRQHPGLTRALPAYTVKLGFGLHQGWAIEGAIGSEYKIDASYLSPHVFLTSRLEELSKFYGTSVLISEYLYDICSKDIQKKLRKIDRIQLNGSESFDLFTCDTDPSRLEARNEDNEIYKYNSVRSRVIARINKESLRQMAENGSVNISNFFETDEDIRISRSGISDLFMTEFAKGLDKYLEGNWEDALHILKYVLKMNECNDGPTLRLINTIESNRANSQGWKGYRESFDV